MQAKNARINVTFEPPLLSLLGSMAKDAHQSIAGFVKELALEALERREDVALSALAQARDVVSAKRVKHEDAWK